MWNKMINNLNNNKFEYTLNKKASTLCERSACITSCQWNYIFFKNRSSDVSNFHCAYPTRSATVFCHVTLSWQSCLVTRKAIMSPNIREYPVLNFFWYVVEFLIKWHLRILVYIRMFLSAQKQCNVSNDYQTLTLFCKAWILKWKMQ